MNYKVEDIYRESGQFDKVVNIELRPDSESFKKYGKHITGLFIYTPKERKALQDTLATDYVGTDGKVRFNEILNALSEEQRFELIRYGIPNTDIKSISQSNIDKENLYAKIDLKSLPKPLEINVDFSDWDVDEMALSLYNQYIKNGYDLCPFENDENIALILLRLSDDNPQKQKLKQDFTDPNTGKLKSSIRLQYLSKKYATEAGLTEEENKELFQIMDEIGQERANILKSELEQSSEKYKELGMNSPENLAKLVALSSSFKPQRLTHNKKPVWWDYERFIHIYIRHVSEIQTGERFKSKTPFQYEFKDIQKLVINVLRTVEDEIQQHFEKNPEKPFKRHGEMSVYYEGDYYVIDIAPDGRLMAFYKKE